MSKNIVKYIYWAVIGASIVLAGLFFFGEAGNLESQLSAASKLSPELKVAEVESIATTWGGTVLNWGIMLFVVVGAFTLVYGLVKFFMGMFSSREGLIRSLVSIGLIAVVAVVGMSLASDAIPNMNVDKLSFELTSSMSKTVGSLIYVTYLFFGLAIIGAVYTEVSKMWK